MKNSKYIMFYTLFRDEQDQLENKLAMMEKKIIVGGENLLEKAEEQEKMLEDSAKELDQRKQKEVELRQALQEKEVFMVGPNGGGDVDGDGPSLGHYMSVTDSLCHYMSVTDALGHYMSVTNALGHYMSVTNALGHYMRVTNALDHYRL